MQARKLKPITAEEIDANWMPIKKAAQKLGVSETTIRNRVDQGTIQARRFYNRILINLG